MADFEELDKIREILHRCERIRVSSSIENFREKLLKKFPKQEWSILALRQWCVFFGLYHFLDYIRFILQRQRVVFWCGGDILNLEKTCFWKVVIPKMEAFHVCENEVEQVLLSELGIRSVVLPMLFDSSFVPTVSFKPSQKPHVYLTAHPGSNGYGVHEIEEIAGRLPKITFHIYGLSKPMHEMWYDVHSLGGGVKDGILHNMEYTTRPNIKYHGVVSNEQFNEEIKEYQSALRLNQFDGFSETVAKSILLGQYPITRIEYPHMQSFDTREELIRLLGELKDKKVPNPNRDFWVKMLT